VRVVDNLPPAGDNRIEYRPDERPANPGFTGGAGGILRGLRIGNHRLGCLRLACLDEEAFKTVLNVVVAEERASRRPEVTPLTREQAWRLLGTLSNEGDRLEALYALALATGLRIGELLGLRWQDVALDGDHSGGELRVRRTLVRTRPKREGYAGYALDTPKGGTGRSVRFKAGAAGHLRAHKARQLEEKLRLGIYLRGQRPRFHQGRRWNTPLLEGVAALRVVACAQQPARSILPHAQTYRSDPHVGERRTPQGGSGNAGPR
jgi:integrase